MTTGTTKSTMTKMVPIVIIIGASLVIASGMATPALALPVVKKDAKDAVFNPSPEVRRPDNLADYDIRSFGMAGDKPYIQVYGKAGRSLALGDEQIFAYVVKTSDGKIWAVNNHGFGHADPEGDEGNIWHSESVIFNEQGCLVGADNESENRMDGTRVFIVGSGETSVVKAQTVELEHVADDPEAAGCPEGSIAKLVHVFDEAPN